MKGKSKQPIEIVLKKADRLTLSFRDGTVLSGDVTAITEECAEAVILEPHSTGNGMKLHHIEIKTSPFYDTSPVLSQIYTFSEAAEIWGIDPSTLRHRVTSAKLIDGIDFRKSGKVWLITKSAMERLYAD